MDCDDAGQHISEFLTLVRVIKNGSPARLQCYADGFHPVLLGIRNDPFGPVFQFIVNLFEEISISENNLAVRFIIEEVS